MTGPAAIHCELFVARSPDQVWEALTNPQLGLRWWAAAGIRPVVGHRFVLEVAPWGSQTCEVTAVEPGRLLSCSFVEKTLGTTITWRLEPEAGGTRLTLEHGGFDLDTEPGEAAFHRMSWGWPGVLSGIERVLPAA